MYSYMPKPICELNIEYVIHIHIQQAHPNRICHELFIHVESELCSLLFHCENTNQQLCWNVCCCQGRHEQEREGRGTPPPAFGNLGYSFLGFWEIQPTPFCHCGEIHRVTFFWDFDEISVCAGALTDFGDILATTFFDFEEFEDLHFLPLRRISWNEIISAIK
jgi:hypothetical protein